MATNILVPENSHKIPSPSSPEEVDPSKNSANMEITSEPVEKSKTPSSSDTVQKPEESTSKTETPKKSSNLEETEPPEEPFEVFSKTLDENIRILLTSLKLDPDSAKLRVQVQKICLLLGSTITLELIHSYLPLPSPPVSDSPLEELSPPPLNLLTVESFGFHLENSVENPCSLSDSLIFLPLHNILKLVEESAKKKVNPSKILVRLTFFYSFSILRSILNLATTPPLQEDQNLSDLTKEVNGLLVCNKNFVRTPPPPPESEDSDNYMSRITKKKEGSTILDELISSLREFYKDFPAPFNKLQKITSMSNKLHQSNNSVSSSRCCPFPSLQRQLSIKLTHLGQYQESFNLLNSIQVDSSQNSVIESTEFTWKLRHDLTKINLKMGHLDKALSMCIELLDDQSRDPKTQLDSPSTVQNVLRIKQTLGEIHVEKGELEDALRIFDEIFSHKQILGSSHLSIMTAERSKGFLLLEQGQHQDALTLLQKLYDASSKNGDYVISNVFSLMAKRGIALALSWLGKSEESILELERVVKELSQILSERHPSTLLAKETLAVVLIKHNRKDEGTTILEKLLKSYTILYDDPQHPRILSVRNALGSIQLKSKKYEEAEKIYRDVLELRTSKLGQSHPHTINSKLTLISILCHLKKVEEASQFMNELCDLHIQKWGQGHPDTLSCLRNRGKFVQHELENYEEAYRIFKEILVIYEEKGSKTLDILKCKGDIASSLYSLKKLDEALEMYREILNSCQKEGMDQLYFSTVSSVALILYLQGKKGEALKIFAGDSEDQRKQNGILKSDLLTYLYNGAHDAYKSGKYGEAKKELQILYDVCVEILGREHTDTLNVKCTIASTLHHMGRYGESVRMFEEVYELRKEHFEQEPMQLADTVESMTAMMVEQGKFTMAIRKIDELAEMLEKKFGNPEHPLVLRAKHSKGIVYHKQDKQKEAEEVFENVLEVRKRVLGKRHPDTVQTKHNISFCRAQARMAKSRFFRGGMAGNLFGGMSGLFSKGGE